MTSNCVQIAWFSLKHKEVRRVETLVMGLAELHASVESVIGDYRATPETFDAFRNRVPHHLRELYDDAPAPMMRLLNSWSYVNGEDVTLEPNTKEFLNGSKATWSLIAQNHRFVRDVEDDLWEYILEFTTDKKAKSTVYAGRARRIRDNYYPNGDGPPDCRRSGRTRLHAEGGG